jgi:V/A-type H+/Na+-transporting ATPase subunit E
MDQKLKELTEKLYNEGVAEGQNQAGQIIERANQQSKAVLDEAEAKAHEIIAMAEKKAAEIEKNTRSEIVMASRQMISALEQEVANLVNGKIVSDAVNGASTDDAFIKQLIIETVTAWAPQQELAVTVPSKHKAELEKYFASKAKALLDKGIVIESANNIKAGFQVGPADGSYRVGFTNNDFIEFFKAFLRPKVVELLFDRK